MNNLPRHHGVGPPEARGPNAAAPCEFFVADVISEVVLGSFWLMLPGLGPNR